MDKKNTILTFEKSQPVTQLDAPMAAYKKLLERRDQIILNKNKQSQSINKAKKNKI